MAYSDHLLSYRQETSEDLLTEKASLKSQRTIFQQQSMGSKAMTRDLRLLEERIQAINYVLAERSYVVPEGPRATPSPMIGVTDFSQIR